MNPSGGTRASWQSVVIFAGLALAAVIPAISYGVHRFPFAYPDADIAFPYWALLMNAGLPTGWYDHPGFFYNLLLAEWFESLKTFGLIAISSFDELPDRDKFVPFFVELIYAARVLSIVEVVAFAALVFFGLRALIGRTWLAGAATLLIVSSPAVALHLLIIRSELLSAIALFAAFFGLAFAAQERRPLFYGFWLIVAGFAGFVAVETKVITFVPLCGACLIIPAFARSTANWEPSEGFSRGQTWLIRLIALTLILPFASEVVRLWDGARSYHFVILGALAIGLIGTVWRRNNWNQEFLNGCAWFAIGLGAAYLFNIAHYDSGNIKPVLYFVDHVRQFAPTQSADGIGGTLILVIGDSLRHRFPVIGQTPGLLIVYVSMIAVLVMTLARRDWSTSLKIGLLVGLDFGTAAVFGIRGSDQYAIYYFFWSVVALAYGVDALTAQRWARHVVICAFACVVFFLSVLDLQIRNLTPAWRPVEQAQICNQAYIYLHRIRDYFDRYCGPDAPPLLRSGDGV